ncbi:MAG: hypothetical protein SOZ89_00695 [Peptoniphilaceae bacterium]|nr:hypothetical protein [Peptoniphilaceae bacterium]MDD7383235.1 hypothetical protein [Peptoniphilaceae bacterium]MDY3737619.1 hypothetical protein [Peptoniphilaceae bacterium]
MKGKIFLILQKLYREFLSLILFLGVIFVLLVDYKKLFNLYDWLGVYFITPLNSKAYSLFSLLALIIINLFIAFKISKNIKTKSKMFSNIIFSTILIIVDLLIFLISQKFRDRIIFSSILILPVVLDTFYLIGAIKAFNFIKNNQSNIDNDDKNILENTDDKENIYISSDSDKEDNIEDDSDETETRNENKEETKADEENEKLNVEISDENLNENDENSKKEENEEAEKSYEKISSDEKIKEENIEKEDILLISEEIKEDKVNTRKLVKKVDTNENKEKI